MAFRNKVKRIFEPVLKPAARWYFSKPRGWKYKHLKLIVNPGVFHPHLTISTKQFLDFLSDKNLKELQVLELGCGTGAMAVYCATQGAKVTATDINEAAIANAKENASKNDVVIETVLSDLFSELPTRTFDRILINPPYYPKAPENVMEQAWYCGAEFEYFEALFATMKPHLKKNAKVWMILSSDCDQARIFDIASKNGWQNEIVFTNKVAAEKQFVIEIKPT